LFSGGSDAVLILEQVSQGRLTVHLAAQALLWLGIKLWLGHLFAANGGQGIFGNNLRNNLAFFSSIFHQHNGYYLRFFLIFGGTWALVPWGCSHLPPPLRNLLCLLLPFTAGMMVAGVIPKRAFRRDDPRYSRAGPSGLKPSLIEPATDRA